MTDHLARDKNIWHPFTPLQGAVEPLLISSGRGARLITKDGREIIDAISSWWVNLHGHAHPQIAAAIADQASQLEQVIFAGFTHEPALKLADRLLQLLPQDQCKIFFSDDGSTAVEVALKMAIQYWHNQGLKKIKVMALEGAYHGDTFGAMSVGQRGAFTLPFHSHLFEVVFVDLPQESNWEKVLATFSQEIEQGEVAAFIFEPLVQGAAGMRMFRAQYLDQMIAVAQKAEVVCIADEVMTGFGRTGQLFASNYLKNKPDIFCLSKGLTGGYLPMSVTTCNHRVLEAFQSKEISKTFFHGHSFTANPIACAAANASLDLLLGESCIRMIADLEQRHNVQRGDWQGHPKLIEVRQTGTILALELATDEATSYFNQARNSIYSYFLNKDILLRPLGNVIYILPPYVITDLELSQVYQAIDDFLEQY